MPALSQCVYCPYDVSETVNVLLSVKYTVTVSYQILSDIEDCSP